MRVLVCNWKDRCHPAAGGAERYTHEVTRRWAAWGHEVTLLTSSVADLPAREEVDGVSIVRAGGRLTVYREARRCFEREARGNVDVVVDEINTRPFGCVRWNPGVPVVALAYQVAREIWSHETRWPVAALGRYWLEPRWLRAYRDTPVLTISPTSRASLEAYGLRRVSVVPVGSDIEPATVVQKAEHPTVAFVGRLSSSKRPEDALTAHALLRNSLPDAELHVVGTGPLEQGLRRRAGPGVTIFGRVDDRRRQEILARSHSLVVTSIREGWGLVVDEAAAAGTPTVAYDVSGLHDSVPAAGGVLVSPSPEVLAARLAEQLPEWIEHPPAAGWRGGAFSWDDVAVAMLDELSKAVAAAPPIQARAS